MSLLPVISQRTLVTQDPITWRYKYWYDSPSSYPSRRNLSNEDYYGSTTGPIFYRTKGTDFTTNYWTQYLNSNSTYFYYWPNYYGSNYFYSPYYYPYTA